MFIVVLKPCLCQNELRMNKVFSSASDIDVKIYYQDTDSIHLNYDDVDKVVKRYKENMVYS